MDAQTIRARVDALRRSHWDYEAAHGEEDRIHQEVLAAIAAGEANPSALAIEALETLKIEFPRYGA
jgi:hypothetical protein